MQHIPDWVEQPLLLVEQNIEYELERQRTYAALATAEPVDAEAIFSCARAREAELSCWNRADRLAVLTPEDRETVLGSFPDAEVRLVPGGADHIAVRRDLAGGAERVARVPAQRPDAPLIVFCANFAAAANVDAAKYLCGEILPRIESEVTDPHVWLVGNAPPLELRALQSERVRVTGRVPSVVPYVDSADVIACPLRIGGGSALNAVEAVRRGKAVVTTSIGAYGLRADARPRS